ncbi:MAG: 50S ribosomal protein L10 [Candidatus Levybacteria bacterium]|nr:50S ribosomal protein L10 [Candidatus Levybacteria bacterium]
MNKVIKSLEKKKTVVAEISGKVNRAKAMVFTNYQGMTHKQIEGLKKALRGVDAELTVTKNTLLKRAIEGKIEDKEFLNSALQNPTATIFAYSNPISPIKELAKIIKALKLPASPAGGQGGPSIKFGIIEGRVVGESDVTRLATLPSRDVLIAQVVGGLKSPIYGLHRALSWNLQKLVITLNAIQKTKAS